MVKMTLRSLRGSRESESKILSTLLKFTRILSMLVLLVIQLLVMSSECKLNC